MDTPTKSKKTPVKNPSISVKNKKRNYVLKTLFEKGGNFSAIMNNNGGLSIIINKQRYSATKIKEMSPKKIKEIFNIDIPTKLPDDITDDDSSFYNKFNEKYPEYFNVSKNQKKDEAFEDSSKPEYAGEAPTPFPSSSSRPSNDLDDVNPETTPTSNASSGNQNDNPKPVSLPASTPIVNKNDQVRQDGNDPVIEAQITPASSLNIDNPEPDYINIKTQQESKVDANLQHDLSKQVRLQEMETTPQKDLPKNVNTDNQSIIVNNANKLETPVSKAFNKTAVNDKDADIVNKEATLLDAEVKNAINTTEEDVDTKLREFLTTYNPENIDYTSPDAVKQYALLTTHLLKQLNDKVEFIPSIDKGVKKVEKIQAEINQGNNITKAGKVEIPEDSNKYGLDAIYDKYITQGDMKYLPEDSYHPALVVGGLRRR